jgi:hypothetical protein
LFLNRNFVHAFEWISEFSLGTFQNLTLPSQFRALDPHKFPGGLDDPRIFYAAPEDAPDLRVTSERINRHGLREMRFTFPSPAPTDFSENNTVYGLADLQAEAVPRGALILLHGHKMVGLEPLRWFTRAVSANGFDVYFPALPYHMQRRPKGTYDGQHAISADLGRTLLGFRQAVIETRALMSWITSRRPAPIFLAGISLGGYLAALTACVDERPAGVVPIVTGASFARLVYEDFSLRYVRRDLEAAGIQQAELESSWALAAPGRWKPLVPREHILLMAGEYDPSVRPENTRDLWRSWGEPAIQWYPFGHTTLFFYSQRVGRDLTAFMLTEQAAGETRRQVPAD